MSREEKYAIMAPVPASDVYIGTGYVAAKFNQLGIKWRWVSHPLAVQEDEIFCFSVLFRDEIKMPSLFKGKRILVGGIGVHWNAKVFTNCPVTYVHGHIENLSKDHLEIDTERLEIGWNYNDPIIPILPNNKLYWPVINYAISSGHGCYYNSCRFCINCIEEQEFYERDPEMVAYVIHQFSKTIKTESVIRLSQDGPSKDWIKNLCFYLQKTPPTIPWATYLRASQIDDELAHNLAKAKCEWVSFGAEYLNNSVLERLNKGVTVQDICNAHSLLINNGVNPLMTFMDLDNVVSQNEKQEHYENLHWFISRWNRKIDGPNVTDGWAMYNSPWDENTDYFCYADLKCLD